MPDRPLEIEVAPGFQRASWRVERIAWCVFGALVVLALLGLLGGAGLLANGSARQGDAAVEFGRFERMQSPATLVVRGLTDASGALRVQIPMSYIHEASVESITPAPASARVLADGIVEYVFDGVPGIPPGTPMQVEWRMAFDTPGVKRAEVRVNGAALSFRQFVYP